MKTVVILILVIVVGANSISLITTINCNYSNYNGSFTFEEMTSKERNFEMCERKFTEFKKQNNTDTTLYRLCKKNIFEFWNWGTYMFSEKFSLPYMSWQTIASRRGMLSARSGFQDF